MSVPKYLATLKRFGLEELTHGDLVLKNGNIAKTKDGNLQFGDSRINALFRLVEEWRLNQSTLDGLFESMLETSQRLEELRKTQQQWFGTWLINDPAKLHKENESIRNHETGSSVFAGAILVVLNNLLRRCQEDLGADDARWKAAGLMLSGYSVGSVVSAAAANFRHHEEWAREPQPDKQQTKSMAVLCAILGQPLMTNGLPTIRTNVCRQILMAISAGSSDRLYRLIFDYAKALAA